MRAARTTARAGRTRTRASSPDSRGAVASDEIWVAAATYKPTATADRTISFALKNGVGVYGGFNGTETMRSQRNPAVNVTILSGDIGTAGSAADNSYHVVTSDGTVTNTGKLDGFTVSGGQADGNPVSNQDRGAGIWVNGGSAFISGVTFTANFASFRGAGARVECGSPRFLSVQLRHRTPPPSAAAAAGCRPAPGP